MVVVGDWLSPIREVLDAVDRPLDVFFRDDDVGWDDDGLEELLDLFADLSLPIDLAVIPNELSEGFSHRLLARVDGSSSRIGFHQHGLAHLNHEPVGRKYEFGPSRARWIQERDIAAGRTRLRDLLGPSVDPIFTPPWNRCTRTTGLCLADLGFEVLSREAGAERLDVPGLLELPIRIDWFAHRRRVRLSRDEFGTLVANGIGQGGPLGLMFHHAAMDSGDRAGAAMLLRLLAGHPMVTPRPMRTLAGALHPGTL
jgi:hypothetical protein